MRKRPFKQRPKNRYFLIDLDFYDKHSKVNSIRDYLLSIPRGHSVKTVKQVEDLILDNLGQGSIVDIEVREIRTVYEVRQ